MIEITFEFPDWATKVKAAMPEIRLFAAAMIQTNRGQMFDDEGAGNGRSKWAPLKFRKGQILSDRGNLRKSWAPTPAKGTAGTDGIVEMSGETITVGTTLYYAALMNWGTTQMPGGVLKPKQAKALKIPTGNGFIFRKSVKIPARRMDLWTDGDAEEINTALTNKFMEVMRR